jgi:Ca2+-binding RTX toxin-like protein
MLRRFRLFVALVGLLAALPAAVPAAAALPAADSVLCPAGARWVDMDDPDRHLAALGRDVLGAFDTNGDAQTCVEVLDKPAEGSLRLAYKVIDLGEARLAQASKGCPAGSGSVDVRKEDDIPVPLDREDLTPFDKNGDGHLCVARLLDDSAGDLEHTIRVREINIVLPICGGKWATIIGTSGNDHILYGTPGDDVIVGLGGNDTIEGRGGHDIICGGEGEDELGSHPIDGSPPVESVLYGGPDDDTVGGDGQDRLYGEGGGDTMPVISTNNLLDGGPGEDSLFMSAFNPSTTIQTMYGGADDDLLSGYIGTEMMHGGAGNDELWGYEGNDELYGDEGDDILYGNDRDGFFLGVWTLDNDLLEGGDGNDKLWGDQGSSTVPSHDVLKGGDGDDDLYGVDGDDELFGGDGNDTIEGGDGDDTIEGGDNADTLKGQVGNDTIDGGAGIDTMEGGVGIDTMEGGGDNDELKGQAGDDTIDGGDGDDTLWGGLDNDTLSGGAGIDRLYGEAGRDELDDMTGYLNGGPNTDFCIGTPGYLTSCENTTP